MPRVFALMCAVALAASGTPTFAQQPAAEITAGGDIDLGTTATFAVPPGWSIARRADAVVLTAPEGDATLAVVTIANAADVVEAATRAMPQAKPGFARTVRNSQALAADGGWDEIAIVRFEVPPGDNVESQALGFRKGDTWTVVAIDGAQATLAKRGGQTDMVFMSIRPHGYVKETFAGRTAHALDPRRTSEMRAFVADAIAKLRIPGAGLALIDDGKIVWEGGIGEANIATHKPVDANTRFMIASNTKGMVTLLLATLVDEGKLDWDTPVQHFMPEFRLGDADTSRKVLVRHLVCACTGLPRDDFKWILGSKIDDTPAANFAQLARTRPTSKFGEVYQYSNPLASAAGYLAAHVLYPDMELGAAFDRAMQERVFDPIGMTRATFGAAEKMDANWAQPYSLAFDGWIGAVDPRLNDVIIPYRPAGGEWASTHDMARYVLEELGAGTMPDGNRVASSRNALVRRDYGVPNGQDVWYGMGLETDTSSGVAVIQHGGSMLGYKTDWYAVPEANAGVVLLLNSDAVSHSLGEIVKRKLLELLYDGQPDAAMYLADRAKRLAEDVARDGKEMTFPVPAPVASELVGNYRDAVIGPLEITRDGGQLAMRTSSHWSQLALDVSADGSRSLVPVSPGALRGQFLVSTRDGKRALVLNDGQNEFVFFRED